MLLNNEKFRPSPNDEEDRIYLTGDMGKFLLDGCLVHLGRKDFQAKIRGYRVETALAPDGPWEAVGTAEGATEQLYTHTLTEPAAWFRVVTETELGDGGITEPRRAFTVVDELYDIRDVVVPGIGFPTTL